MALVFMALIGVAGVVYGAAMMSTAIMARDAYIGGLLAAGSALLLLIPTIVAIVQQF